MRNNIVNNSIRYRGGSRGVSGVLAALNSVIGDTLFEIKIRLKVLTNLKKCIILINGQKQNSERVKREFKVY